MHKRFKILKNIKKERRDVAYDMSQHALIVSNTRLHRDSPNLYKRQLIFKRTSFKVFRLPYSLKMSNYFTGRDLIAWMFEKLNTHKGFCNKLLKGVQNPGYI